MLEEFSIHINQLDSDRMVRVYVPNDYHDTNSAYPVLYMHDGQNLFRNETASYGTSWGIKDYLDESPVKVIVVGIDCNTQGYSRLDEYSPWVNETVGKKVFHVDEVFGGKGDTYVDFIVHDLKPFIDNKYRTITDDTAMAGSSMGGLISTYAACRFPHMIRKIAAVSSAFWFSQQELEALIRQSDLTGIQKFYMDVGTKEGETSEMYQAYVESNKSVYNALKATCVDCRFEIVEGAAHNEEAWSKRVPGIFEYLYG